MGGRAVNFFTAHLLDKGVNSDGAGGGGGGEEWFFISSGKCVLSCAAQTVRPESLWGTQSCFGPHLQRKKEKSDPVNNFQS